MSNPQEIRRKYNIADDKVLEDSSTTHALMTAQLPLFTAFDPTLNATFMSAWQADIDAAEGQESDELYRDRIQVSTQTVSETLNLCRSKYNELKYYVQKAFATDAARQQEFGLDDYDIVRQSDTKMLEFMRRMHEVAQGYAAQLTDPSVGYSNDKIDEIKILADRLEVDNTEQEVKKKQQSTATQTRIQRYNAMWDKRTLVARAAKIIFATDYASYQKYLLPPSESPDTDFALRGIVRSATTGSPIEDATVRITSLGLELSTDSAGKYGIADNVPPGTYTIDVEAAGYMSQSITATILSPDETIVLNVDMVPTP